MTAEQIKEQIEYAKEQNRAMKRLRGTTDDCVVTSRTVKNDDIVDFLDHSGLWMEVK